MIQKTKELLVNISGTEGGSGPGQGQGLGRRVAKGPVETRVLNWSPAQSMQIGVPRDPGSSPVRDPKPCQWGVGEQALLLRTCPQLSKVLLGAGHTDLSSSASFCVSLKSWVPPLHFHHSSPDSAPSVQFTCSVYVGTANNWSSFWRGLFCTSLAARTCPSPQLCCHGIWKLLESHSASASLCLSK